MRSAVLSPRFAASLALSLACAAATPSGARAQTAPVPAAPTGTQTGTRGPAATGTQTDTHKPAATGTQTDTHKPAATGAQNGTQTDTQTDADGAQGKQEDVRALFEQGVAAHDAGKLETAEGLFSRAWARKRSWDIAVNLGVVLRKRGQNVRAAELFTFALAALPPSESDSTREGIARELAQVMPTVGRVRVRTNVAGAAVRVGGHLRGTTPLEAPVIIAPGVVLVEVRKEGHEPALEYVRADAGASVEVTVTLTWRPERAERELRAPLVAFGFGAAGLLTGAIATGVSAAKLSELKGHCGADLVCPPDARENADAGRAAGHVATAGFVLAGLGAAVGLTLLALPTRTTPTRDGRGSSPRVGLLVGPGLVGLKGAF